jgi:rubrerythrin
MKFSIRELVDVSIQIEESGYSFYTQCGKKFQQKEFQYLFAYLADQERRHKETFETLFSGMGGAEGQFTEEYLLYLRAIAGERVFRNANDVDAAVRGLPSIQDVFRIALTAEKDSILWYSELLTVYGEGSQASGILRRLIDEERSHVVALLDLREKISLAGERGSQ